jgi:hypothetical protein
MSPSLPVPVVHAEPIEEPESTFCGGPHRCDSCDICDKLSAGQCPVGSMLSRYW